MRIRLAAFAAFPLAFWLAASPLASALPASAATLQGGYDVTRFKELGLEFPVPRDYEQIPTQPDEEWVVLYFAERVPKDPDKRKAVRPELNVVWIDWVPDATPSTPGPDAPPDPSGGPTGGGAGGGGTGGPPSDPQGSPPGSSQGGASEEKPPPPINTFERFVGQRLHGWELSSVQPRGAEKGWERFEATLVRDSKAKGNVAGMALWLRGPKRTIGFFGIASQEDFEKQSRIWRAMVDKLEIGEPEDGSRDKWLRYYETRDVLDAAYRIDVRSKLVRGWNAEDTKNYILIFDTKDRPLIRLVAAELEAMRGEYERLFPPTRPVTAVSAVRVCKDRAEYHQYGGPPGSGGYWNSDAQELVFYDYENVKGKANTGKANSRIVLYHEAFHQFIHYSCGELAPHSWFNEGTGDFFSGAVISGGKVTRIGVNPWRIETIQRALEASQEVDWAKIIRYSQREYYTNPGLCYAQGWSMIYFLRTARAVERNARWKQILPVYFDTLKQAWAAELAGLETAGKTKDDEARATAQERAREAAVSRAFEGVDLDEIQKAWREYTLGLKPPKG